MKKPGFFTVGVATVFSSAVAAQSACAQSVSGRINEWGNRAQGVQQVLVQAFQQGTAKKVGEALTDALGKYEITALPTGVPLELRFEKDHYLRHPIVWQTTLASKDAHNTYDDQMCAVRPGSRGDGPKFDPNVLAQYLKAKSADVADRQAYYRAQWESLKELHLTSATLGLVAAGLAQEDPEALTLPEIKAANDARVKR